MTDNEKHLQEAQTLFRQFETEKEPERLREASMALENVYLPQEYDARVRNRLRRECLALWLEIIRTLDKRLDPQFDAEDMPDSAVSPPPTAAGVVYPPGADPDLLDDSKAREEYRKKIADNNAKIEDYRIQTQLRRLNEQIPPRAAEFIENSYTEAAADQEELKKAFDEGIEKPERKAELSKLLKTAQP